MYKLQPARALAEAEAGDPLGELIKDFVGNGLEGILPLVDDNEMGANSVSSLLVFADVSLADGSMEDVQPGMISQVRFDEEALNTSFVARLGEGRSPTQYKGIAVYEEVGDYGASFAVLGDGVLVSGTTETVKAVIDIHAGDGKSVSGHLMEAFDSLGEPMAKLAMAVPPNHYAQLTQNTDSPEDDAFAEALEEVDLITVVADKEGTLNTLALNIRHSSTTGAELMKEQVKTMANVLQVYVDEPAKGFFDNVAIENRGPEVEVAVTVPAHELREFADGLNSRARWYIALVISVFLAGEVPTIGH